MYLIDTSVWIKIFRDQTGIVRQNFETLVQDEPIFLTRFTQLELLQGAKNKREWLLLETYLEKQDYVEINQEIWVDSARIYYDLRRKGLTVRSSIDCCIAQLALSYRLILVHDDRDFETIKQVRNLSCLLFKSKN
jgi:predicted nucleic acid-binding protein